MNRNDMPFLGVYDNVLVQALIVPLHIKLNCTPKVRHKTFGVHYV